MDKQQYRNHLREGFLGMKDFLKRIEEVSEFEERKKQIKEEYKKWDMHLSAVVSRPSGVHYEEPCGLGEYEALLSELKDLKNESSTSKPNSKNCSQCSKEIISNPINKEFCSQICSLSSEITNLISGNYYDANADKLHQLAQKLLELAQEYSKTLSPSLKPYCDSLLENLQQLANSAHETWNSSDKLQGLLNYCQEKEKSIGKANLVLLKGGTMYLWPGTGYCFWNGYDQGKKIIEWRIEKLGGSSNNIKGNNKNNQEEISCWGCYKEIKVGKSYWYHKSKDDGYKFCSTKCYDDCYGEYCYKCRDKFLTVYHWDKEKYPNLVYCSTCYEKNKQEEQESEERLTIYCRYCSAKCSGIFDVCEKKECLKKMNKETEKNTQIHSQITLLAREINQLTNKPTRNPTEEALLTSKKKDLAELLAKQQDANTNSSKPGDKTTLAIGGGVIAVVLVGLVLILVRKKKNKSKY